MAFPPDLSFLTIWLLNSKVKQPEGEQKLGGGFIAFHDLPYKAKKPYFILSIRTGPEVHNPHCL